MNLALALDDLLGHPDLARVVEDARTHTEAAGYGWLLDQAGAATQHTQRILAAIAAEGGGDLLPVTFTQHPDWVRLGLLDSLATWITGQSSTCLHGPDPMRPQPVVAAAWKPGLIVCTACVRLLSLRKGSPKDRTCDGCGTVVPDTGDIWANATSYGEFVYRFGVCDGCRYWPVPAAA
ncbi:hypothetical protein ACLQ2R_19580 [Streptosporangium sp. DT93]|uniref:hypothetical protein n=1 Tax=Streptosporangium sp. DT93 TaxID=3393428 RepID=UPI003CF4EBF5